MGRTLRTVGWRGVEGAVRQRDPESLSHKLEESYAAEPPEQEYPCWTDV